MIIIIILVLFSVPPKSLLRPSLPPVFRSLRRRRIRISAHSKTVMRSNGTCKIVLQPSSIPPRLLRRGSWEGKVEGGYFSFCLTRRGLFLRVPSESFGPIGFWFGSWGVIRLGYWGLLGGGDGGWKGRPRQRKVSTHEKFFFRSFRLLI